MIPDSITQQLRNSPFVPHPALKGPHAQTIISSLAPRRATLLNQASEVRYFIVAPEIRLLAHCSWQPERTSKPCILIVHGLEGSSQSQYMVGTGEKAFSAGFNVVRLNLRNCGGVELRPTFYHAGLSEDVRHVLDELVEKDGFQELYLIGFSLGGNMSLKYIGEEGSRISKAIRAVVAISPSVHLPSCIDALEQRSNTLYHLNFVFSMKRSLRRKARLFPDRLDASLLRNIWTLRKFDDVFTAPFSGFRGAAEYYDRASSLPLIPSIAVPALIIHAKDDPFIPYRPLDCLEVSNNANVLLLAPKQGGHVGFIAAQPEANDRYWAEHRALEFIQLVRGVTGAAG